jgi:hypothetical protein
MLPDERAESMWCHQVATVDLLVSKRCGRAGCLKGPAEGPGLGEGELLTSISSSDILVTDIGCCTMID